VKLFRRGWPIIIPLYDVRECPECCNLVSGRVAQRLHEEWHRELDRALGEVEELPEPGGYCIPDSKGNLPIEVIGGIEDDEYDGQRR